MNMTKTIQFLKQKRFAVSYFEKSQEAAAYLNQVIDNQSVGFGDSDTLLHLNLYESLSLHNQVYDPQHCLNDSDFLEIAKKVWLLTYF